MQFTECKCGNAARYINARGELCCGICPLKERIDSIQLRNVAPLLAWVRKYQDNVYRMQNTYMDHASAHECRKTRQALDLELADIVQNKPE